jgi:Rps23 Pro-64 3,4-dihydroxylase Tpa1-like proline 4-hydroxylase
MPALNLRKVDDYWFFDEHECRQAGRVLAAAYRNAQPFPHIVVDDFLNPQMLRDVHASYPPAELTDGFDREQEKLKFQFHANQVQSGLTKNLLAELNSQAFLAFLEEMTGIEGLIPDPYYSGAGLHVTKPGGHLGVHADFNVHGIMGVERRLNLLVYLNEDWQPGYGGALELWSKAMNACERSVEPLIGRAVVFSTTLDSFHGHPDPLTCPPHRDRRSIATYYYTAFPAAAEKVRSTNFQVRPNSLDKADRAARVESLIHDWVPPRLQRYAHRLNPFR